MNKLLIWGEYDFVILSLLFLDRYIFFLGYLIWLSLVHSLDFTVFTHLLVAGILLFFPNQLLLFLMLSLDLTTLLNSLLLVLE